ncbi:MAG TPA: urea ABC transporter permease subunit UrtB [Burkholderiales bacterium]|nr:urea ABC transporter permease subunit UrtB [Burkholderiales bacterium]
MPLRLVILAVLAMIAVSAAAAVAPETVQRLAGEDSDEKIAAVQAIAATPGEAALRILRALGEDRLAVAGGRLVVQKDQGFMDAETGAILTPAPAAAEPITINNRVRREVQGALAGLRLFSPERDKRLEAARELEGSAEPEIAPAVRQALDRETDPQIRDILQLAYAQATLKSPDPALRLEAARALGASGNPNVKLLLAGLMEKKGGEFVEPDEDVRRAASASLRELERRLAWAETAGRVFSGISLGSILLLGALGLAITYGVMGVINMAHGELLMVGAYATFMVQGLFRSHLPGLLDWYVLAAVPAAFLSAALAGMLMERLVIRHLYGRPLETLLATWGLSLVLIQAARVSFGAQNVELANPSWMSGGIEIMSNLVLPWNRIAIIAFSLAVLLLVWVLMNLTRLGLFVRAVTQNRAMAGCMGVPTGRVDTLAFGLGAGIAGLGGCALSQVANVGPDMGQGYIVDAFMVVVLGGVGQLAGAVSAALGLGIIAKFLEGWTGAVIAKIVVLAAIIIFIQKRPQGLFALKGRFADA